jgi:hypothetical protein
MSRNGERRPPRPRIVLVTPAPSPQAAAAITAAIERFFADTAPAPSPGGPSPSGWQRAALLEGVGAHDELSARWGGVRSRAALVPRPAAI